MKNADTTVIRTSEAELRWVEVLLEDRGQHVFAVQMAGFVIALTTDMAVMEQ
jgi:hypothetical protein